MDKYGKLCTLFNILLLILLWAICIVIVFLLTGNWILRIVVALVALFPCALLEERILSSIVNSAVEKMLKHKK